MPAYSSHHRLQRLPAHPRSLSSILESPENGREGSLFIRGMSVCFSSSLRLTSGRLKFIRAHSFPTRHQKSGCASFHRAVKC